MYSTDDDGHLAMAKGKPGKEPPSVPKGAEPDSGTRGVGRPLATPRTSTAKTTPGSLVRRRRPAHKMNVFRSAPSWLASSIVHLLVLIGLALWVFAPQSNRGMTIDAVFAEDQGYQLLDELVLVDVEDTDFLEQVNLERVLPEVRDPFAAPPQAEIVVDGMSATSDIQASIPSQSALDGRLEGSKQQLLAQFGGNAQSEAAVLAGLKWLVKQQQSNGVWSLKGPYQGGAGVENFAAATSMALLAFQGAGYTHVRPSQFRKNVARAVETLLALQNEDGSFFDDRYGRNNHRFYTHAQATIAVCELYAMTGDAALLEPARAAVAYCVENQDPARGGWRYIPQQDSDTSVTGWVVMALQSARMAGLEVPSETFDRVMSYLDGVSEDDGSRYAYHAGASTDAPMTAEALLCRQYLGWEQSDPRLMEGIAFLLQEENLPAWNESRRNVYYWYYATQAMHHMEGESWNLWNGVMRDMLAAHQEQSGRERGSWNPTLPIADRWGHQGGRLFVTCLSIYVLEVYYRHLPIYSSAAGRPIPG